MNDRSTVNKVILVGRLGDKPDLRSTTSGLQVVNFSLATNTINANKEEKTEWHRIVAFDRLADYTSKYLNKGQLIYLEGRLQTRQWVDKETEQKRYTTEIIAYSITSLSSPKRDYNNDSTSYDNSNSQGYQSSESSIDTTLKNNEPENISQDNEDTLDDVPF